MKRLKFIFNCACKNYRKLTELEPRVKGDQINQIVYILRRDFDIDDQNDIVLSVVEELNKLREKDIEESTLSHLKLTNGTEFLKERIHQ